MESTFNLAYDAPQKRDFFVHILFSMLFIPFFAVVLLLCIIIVAFGNDFISKIISDMTLDFAFVNIFALWRWTTTAAILFFVLSFTYKLLPSTKIKCCDTLPGTLFSISGFLILTALFSFYVNNFVSSVSLFESIGTIVLLMLWMYFTGIIIVLGAELNKIVYDFKNTN